jgi:hypothetical protein
LIQNFFIKEVHQIVGKHQKLKPSIVATAVVRDYLVQPKTVYPFLDKVFTTGLFITISPNFLSLLSMSKSIS